MKLIKKIKAPSFKLKNSNNEVVNLKSIKSSYIVLYFYPKDDTPGCTIETNDFNKLLKEFKKLDNWCKFEHYPFEKPLHEIYEKEYCLSPIPSLAMHCTNINSIFGLSPNFSWKKMWEENEVN